jgi:hypothetical protein
MILLELWTWIKGSALFALLGTLIVLALKTYIKSQTKNFFDKNIENHKHELTKSLKEVEFDYQRKIQDFTLYTQKRHSVYAELYEKVLNAVGEMQFATSLFRTYPIPQSNHVDTEELRAVLLNENFEEKDVNEVVSEWRIDPNAARKKTCRLFDFKRLNKANELRVKAHKYFLESELYLNETLSKEVKELMSVMYEMHLDELTSIQYPEERVRTKELQMIKENHEKLTKGIDHIKKLMREDLSIGDYFSS